jgi:two-component sensor histidine kinase
MEVPRGYVSDVRPDRSGGISEGRKCRPAHAARTGRGIDARALLAQAGIDAEQRETAERLQKLILEELHHRIKNTLATVSAVAAQSLRTATSIEHGQHAIESRLLRLHLTWTEKGGPAVHAPTRQSFGTRLIETLGRQLNGKVEMAYDLKGFVYALDVPLNSLTPPD